MNENTEVVSPFYNPHTVGLYKKTYGIQFTDENGKVRNLKEWPEEFKCGVVTNWRPLTEKMEREEGSLVEALNNRNRLEKENKELRSKIASYEAQEINDRNVRYELIQQLAKLEAENLTLKEEKEEDTTSLAYRLKHVETTVAYIESILHTHPEDVNE